MSKNTPYIIGRGLAGAIIVAIIGISVLGLAISPAAFGAGHGIDSPLKQVKMGVAPEDVICKEGY